MTEPNSAGWLGIPLDLAWHDAIGVRTSRRRYDGRPVASAEWENLRGLCASLSATGVRITLVNNGGEDLFTGIVGGYGKPGGSPCAALFSAADGRDLEVGYVGEALILAATSLSLNTCWVAGNFDRKAAARRVQLNDGERVWAATPIGYALENHDAVEKLISSSVRARSRLSLADVAPGSERWPRWARCAVEAARLAPSGGNKQPWRFALNDGGDELVLAEVANRIYWTHTIDCGIAMLHAELGVLSCGTHGEWSKAPADQNGDPVATFRLLAAAD